MKIIKVKPDVHNKLKIIAVTAGVTIGKAIETIIKDIDVDTVDTDINTRRFSVEFTDDGCILKNNDPFRSPVVEGEWTFTGPTRLDLTQQVYRFIHEYRGKHPAMLDIEGMVVPVK